MSLVPLIDPADVDEYDRPTMEIGETAYGKQLNTWRAIAQRPGMFAAYLPFIRAVAGPGSVPMRIKDLTAIYVCVLNHCRYSTSHRCASAAAQSVPDADVVAVATGNHDHFEPELRLALELARVMTLDFPAQSITDAPSGIDMPLREQLQQTFTPGELAELTMSISLWNALSRFHRVMDLELDMPAPPPAVDGVL
jgi:alkylhydroperoxidase family enzyme